MYRGSALLLVATGVAALGATLPIADLFGSGGGTRLGFATVRAFDAGVPWSRLLRPPATAQQEAVTRLFELLAACALAALVAGGITILTLSAVRAAGREPEIAVRRAVGAARRHLAGAALLEGSAVGMVALGLGGLLGLVGTRLAACQWPGQFGPGTLAAALGAAGGIAIGILSGALLPLLFARHQRMVDAEPKPQGLVIPTIQLGLSLAVLVAAGLVMRHSREVLQQAGSAEGDGEVYQVSMGPGAPAVRAARYARLLQRIGGRPGVMAMSLSTPGMLTGLGTVDVATTDCGYCSEGGLLVPWRFEPVVHQVVSADTFRTLGISLLGGRGITAGDDWDAPRVAVVSRELASRDFQNGEAVGRKIRIGQGDGDWYTVVGVVENRRPAGFGGALQPPFTVYLSILQHPATSVDLLVRGGGDSQIAPILAELSGASVRRISEADLLGLELAPLTWFARWFGIEGAALLLIAAVGTFAVMRLWVTSLLPELGLRRALGARRRHLLGFVLLRASGVGIGGTIIGAWFGPALWESLSSLVSDLPVWDAGVFAPLAFLLVSTAVAGALAPAWQASRATPRELLGSTGA
jgi:hypothetical protein